MIKLNLCFLLATAIVTSAAEISPSLKGLQGKWNGERVNSDGQRSKTVLEIKDDKLEFRSFTAEGDLRFVAKGVVKAERAGELRLLTASGLRAGRTEDDLEPVDDDRVSVYSVRDGKLYLASGFDKERDNERPRVDEYTKQEGAARSETATSVGILLGTWKMEATMGDHNMDYELRFEQAAGVLKGTLISPRTGEYKAKSVTFKDGKFEMLVDRRIEDNDVTFVYRGNLKGNALAGILQVKGLEDQFTGNFKARR